MILRNFYHLNLEYDNGRPTVSNVLHFSIFFIDPMITAPNETKLEILFISNMFVVLIDISLSKFSKLCRMIVLCNGACIFLWVLVEQH